MAIMLFEQWYELTHETFNFRGSELTAIDEALKKFHAASASASARATAKASLKTALDKWIKKNGANWRSESRNEKGGFSKLLGQMEDLEGPTARDVEFQKYIADARRGAMKRIFAGRKLSVKRSTVAMALGSVGTALEDTRSAVSKLNGGGSSVTSSAAERIVQELLKGLFHTDIISEITGELTKGFMGHMIAAVTPFVGHIKSGGEAIAYTALAARSAYRESEVRDHAVGALDGDPRSAVEAILELQGRSTSENGRKAAISGTEFVARSGAALLDGGIGTGAAIGAASAMAKLINNIYVIGRDYTEKRKANVLLESDEPLTARLFKVNPVLGAYFITYGETSDLANILSGDLKSRDWQELVEWLAKTHIEPLKARARQLIFDSRFEIDGLTVRGTGFIDGTKQAVMDKLSLNR
jgi:hypothetical protein